MIIKGFSDALAEPFKLPQIQLPEIKLPDLKLPDLTTEVKPKVDIQTPEIDSGGGLDGLIEFFKRVRNAVETELGPNWGKIVDFFGGITIGPLLIGWEALKELFKLIRDNAPWLVNAWWILHSWLTGVGEQVKTTLIGEWNLFANLLRWIGDDVRQTLLTAWGTFSSWINTVGDNVKQSLSGAWNTVVRFFTKVRDGITNSLDTVWNKIKEGFDKIKSIVDNIVSTISGIVSSITSAPANIAGGITKPFDPTRIVYLDPKPLPGGGTVGVKRQFGGLLDEDIIGFGRGTGRLWMLHRGEEVVPAHRVNTQQNNAVTVNVTINIDKVEKTMDLEEIRSFILRALHAANRMSVNI